jgi:hypothetical protein
MCLGMGHARGGCAVNLTQVSQDELRFCPIRKYIGPVLV